MYTAMANVTLLHCMAQHLRIQLLLVLACELHSITCMPKILILGASIFKGGIIATFPVSAAATHYLDLSQFHQHPAIQTSHRLLEIGLVCSFL